MKKGLYELLVIVALVFLPSCSNILEDSGSPSAIAETGKLSLALEADASVSVTTKATSTVTISDEVKNNLVITGTKEGSSITLGKSSDFADGVTRAVPAGTYTELSATYSQMTGDLQFDSPMLAGEDNGNRNRHSQRRGCKGLYHRHAHQLDHHDRSGNVRRVAEDGYDHRALCVHRL